jgi:hypothetical protein
VAWGSARLFPNNSPFAHDHLPFAAWTGAGLDIVWVRHDLSQPAPWLQPPASSEIRYSFSPDGASWSGEFPVTIDPGPTVHVFPALYPRSASEWRLIWITTRSGPAQVVELCRSELLSYPSALSQNAFVSPGYSHRVTRTPVAGLYFGAWVQGPEGAQEIYYRFYED